MPIILKKPIKKVRTLIFLHWVFRIITEEMMEFHPVKLLYTGNIANMVLNTGILSSMSVIDCCCTP
ncbi:MAG: hypothetical protein R2757_12125 [Draconibacterium sp.]